MNATSKTDLRAWREGAILTLLPGCGLRSSEVVGLRLDQIQTTEGRWVIVDLVGKGDGYELCQCRHGARSLWMPGSGFRA
jgi:site-specific recombinase XerC